MKYCMAVVLFLVSINAYADARKWVDSEGRVHYSDSPPPGNVKSENVRISPSPGAPGSAPASSAAAASAPAGPKTIFEKEADMKKAKKAKEEAAQKQAQEQEQADAKRKNCEQARIQYQTLQNSPRVSVYDEKGERTVLDDAGRQQRINEAQDAIKKFCN